MYNTSETISLVAGLSDKRLETCLSQGWVRVSVGTNGPAFAEIDVARLGLICTLQDEMDVDDDLLPTMLSLLDQVYGLRRELRNVMQAIASEPDDIQKRLATKLL